MTTSRTPDPSDCEPLRAAVAGKRPTIWVTRERPKIDRIACPWAVRRFIDDEAVILFAPTERVFEIAAEKSTIAFDIPGAPISHEGPLCSFDTLLRRLQLDRDPALAALAPIVRGADTDRHDLAPESAGLHAVSIGLSANYADDHELLAQGFILYDALYAWASRGRSERHSWKGAAA